LVASDDGDGAGCVQHALVADRSESKLGESAAAAAADDEQLGVQRLSQQCHHGGI